ncbi:hypothetical protein Fcan01_16773 [Folsomia candida]|uniref:Chitin-binding type-2 domain-containing protein n=1 Tax=Folsomia candida TaxID=158441 RepID=A0A226DU36_FOLCA|nr:hypothetical protein Fcan01_16773 [Folsomia candida]
MFFDLDSANYASYIFAVEIFDDQNSVSEETLTSSCPSIPLLYVCPRCFSYDSRLELISSRTRSLIESYTCQRVTVIAEFDRTQNKFYCSLENQGFCSDGFFTEQSRINLFRESSTSIVTTLLKPLFHTDRIDQRRDIPHTFNHPLKIGEILRHPFTVFLESIELSPLNILYPDLVNFGNSSTNPCMLDFNQINLFIKEKLNLFNPINVSSNSFLVTGISTRKSSSINETTTDPLIPTYYATTFSRKYIFTTCSSMTGPSAHYSFYLSPFDTIIWIALGICLLLIPMLLISLNSLSNFDSGLNLGMILSFIQLSPMFEVPPYISQEVTKRIKLYRPIIVSWMLMCIILSNGYKSILTNTVVAPMDNHSPKTFRELVQNSTFQIFSIQDEYPRNVPLEWGAISAKFGGIICPPGYENWPHEHCTRFYSCSDGFIQEIQCPGGLYFDMDAGICNLASLVTDCNSDDGMRVSCKANDTNITSTVLLPHPRTEFEDDLCNTISVESDGVVACGKCFKFNTSTFEEDVEKVRRHLYAHGIYAQLHAGRTSIISQNISQNTGYRGIQDQLTECNGTVYIDTEEVFRDYLSYVFPARSVKRNLMISHSDESFLESMQVLKFSNFMNSIVTWRVQRSLESGVYKYWRKMLAYLSFISRVSHQSNRTRSVEELQPQNLQSNLITVFILYIILIGLSATVLCMECSFYCTWSLINIRKYNFRFEMSL